jgi:hypothetical protein
MAIVPESLSQNGAEGDVGINDENPPGMAAVIGIIRLSHKRLI